MSSTNKTSNLGLNQWVLTDPLLMEDMNADNRKIDTAVGANPYVKLLDTTLSSNAQQVDIALSTLDLTKYSSIKVIGQVKVTGAANSIYVKINNGGGYIRDTTIANSSIASQVYAGYVYPTTYTSDYFSTFELNVAGVPDSITAAYLARLHLTGSAFNSLGPTYYYFDFAGLLPVAANIKISTVNILTDNSGVYIKAGSRFEVYGVKK